MTTPFPLLSSQHFRDSSEYATIAVKAVGMMTAVAGITHTPSSKRKTSYIHRSKLLRVKPMATLMVLTAKQTTMAEQIARYTRPEAVTRSCNDSASYSLIRRTLRRASRVRRRCWTRRIQRGTAE